MTQPRQVVPGRTYLISRRCVQRQFLLRPDEKTNRVLLYCLAVAARRHAIEVYALLAMSNHYHYVVFDPRGCLPEFLRYLNLMMAKAMNFRWNRRENLWSVEQASATWLVDDEDVLAKCVYGLVNPVVDDLVERVADWPGISSWSAHLRGGSITIERPRGFFRDGGPMPERVELKLSVPRRAANPEERWLNDEWNQCVVSAVRSAEEAALVRRRASGIRVLGRQAIRQQSPFDAPKTYERRGGLRPTLACRVGERRSRELTALRVFRQQHRVASQAHLKGDRAVVFPEGTWAMRNLCRSCQPAATGS